MRLPSILALLIVITAWASPGLGVLNPLWFGIWMSEDGRTTMKISASRIEMSRRIENEKFNYSYRWTDATLANGEHPYTFGYSREHVSQRDLTRKLRGAIANQDPVTRLSARELKNTRRAIEELGPGTYKMMWTYDQGDFDVKYILDGDKMLAIDDNMYRFAVRTFRRISH